MLAHLLQERGVAGIEIQQTVADDGTTLPGFRDIYLSPHARDIFFSIYDSPEIEALQHTVNSGAVNTQDPDFEAITMPAFQSEELWRRLMAIRYDNGARHVGRDAKARGVADALYIKVVVGFISKRDEWLNFNGGKSKLPTRREIRGLVQAAIDARLPR